MAASQSVRCSWKSASRTSDPWKGGWGRWEDGGGGGGSRIAALFCHREGELTAVSPPERFVLKVPFYSAPRRRRRRRARLSCSTDGGTSEGGWRAMRGHTRQRRGKTLLSSASRGPATQPTVVKGDRSQLCSLTAESLSSNHLDANSAIQAFRKNRDASRASFHRIHADAEFRA